METTLLTERELETICAMIEDGFAAFESSPRMACGGYAKPDDTRTYFVELGGGRLAKVWAARRPGGQWYIGAVEFFVGGGNFAQLPGATEQARIQAADEIAAAIENDPRTIEREEANAFA